jgi:hypothetical protein
MQLQFNSTHTVAAAQNKCTSSKKNRHYSLFMHQQTSTRTVTKPPR